jgi:hypothetical protein
MTTRAFKLSRLALAATAGMVCLSINDNLSSSQQSGLIMQADARVGRPLTAGSVAGVARRTGRRAYRRGAMVGGAALGAGAYYGSYGYGSGYGAYGGGYGPYGYGSYAGGYSPYGSSYGAYGSNYGGDNAVAYCTQRFRSYDPSSGTYLGRDGHRHACP